MNRRSLVRAASFGLLVSPLACGRSAEKGQARSLNAGAGGAVSAGAGQSGRDVAGATADGGANGLAGGDSLGGSNADAGASGGGKGDSGSAASGSDGGVSGSSGDAGGSNAGAGASNAGAGGSEVDGSAGALSAGEAGDGSGGRRMDDPNSGPDTMGNLGCSFTELIVNGYRRTGGTRMWAWGGASTPTAPWTQAGNASWARFNNQVEQFGTPTAMWVQICAYGASLATSIEEVRIIVSNLRDRAPDTYIYITGLPQYPEGHMCQLASAAAVELTDTLARQAAEEDPRLQYAGPLGRLTPGEISSDGCQPNASGEDRLGRDVREIWGQP